MLIDKHWGELLKEIISSEEIIELKQELLKEKERGAIVFPKEEEIFKAFKKVDYENVKAVILGQDPYHGEGQAEGLAFSVKKGVKIPPSLQNIYKELNHDLKISIPNHGSLESWSKDVLLLNTSLTVLKDQAASHAKIGWQNFTSAVIRLLLKREKPLVFLLWGRHAQEAVLHLKEAKNTHHLILTAAHPSPFSANNGFFGCSHFSKTNQFLIKHGIEPIDWSIK